MSQDTGFWFATSTIGWFRSNAEDVLFNIASRLNPAPTTPGHIFRPDQLQNATTQRIVPTAAERLVRWETYVPGVVGRHYSVVFRDGFEPHIRPSRQTFPDVAFNLRRYVLDWIPSIFVSTSRYYRNETNALRRWRARNIESHAIYFEYEIFAYGGIDVNNVLDPNHRFRRQHEIAFPGGIRPEFIRSVRIYRGADPVEVVENPRFTNLVNPPSHIVDLVDLPGPVIIQGLDIVYYPPEAEDHAAPPHGHDELRRRRDVNFAAAYDPSEDYDQLMRGDGDEVEDPFLQYALARPCVAAVLHPSDSGRAYFFFWNTYVAIDIAPGSTNDTIAWGPKQIIGNWPSLVKANFGYVDAVLPNPDNKEEMYFFFRKKYALINIKPGTTDDYIINGPKNISTEWPSLNQAGFDTVDAVLQSPNHKYEAYIFSGEYYILIHYEPGKVNDYIINGPKLITTEWPSLKKAGFKTVDTILPHPIDANQSYVFSGDQYVLIYFSPGAVNDYIINGPKLVRTEWPSLRNAHFW